MKGEITFFSTFSAPARRDSTFPIPLLVGGYTLHFNPLLVGGD